MAQIAQEFAEDDSDRPLSFSAELSSFALLVDEAYRTGYADALEATGQDEVEPDETMLRELARDSDEARDRLRLWFTTAVEVNRSVARSRWEAYLAFCDTKGFDGLEIARELSPEAVDELAELTEPLRDDEVARYAAYLADVHFDVFRFDLELDE